MTSLSDRISTLEQKYPDEADDYTVQCILSRLTDAELDIMETAAKLREKGFSEDEIEKKMGPDQWQECQKALEHSQQIHAALVARAARGELPGIMIAGREVCR